MSLGEDGIGVEKSHHSTIHFRAAAADFLSPLRRQLRCRRRIQAFDQFLGHEGTQRGGEFQTRENNLFNCDIHGLIVHGFAFVINGPFSSLEQRRWRARLTCEWPDGKDWKADHTDTQTIAELPYTYKLKADVPADKMPKMKRLVMQLEPK